MINKETRTPREIVEYLDKYIIGQDRAKKSVAIALRNRWRRQEAPEEIGREILPNNILMIGPTGVGKTEIARRLAELAGAPFMKVEASKFTEVGYVGRDVESMVRDLVDLAVNMVKQETAGQVADKAQENTDEKLLDLLLPPPPPKTIGLAEKDRAIPESKPDNATRQKLRDKLLAGKLDERMVELDTPQDGGGNILADGYGGVGDQFPGNVLRFDAQKD